MLEASSETGSPPVATLGIAVDQTWATRTCGWSEWPAGICALWMQGKAERLAKREGGC